MSRRELLFSSTHLQLCQCLENSSVYFLYPCLECSIFGPSFLFITPHHHHYFSCIDLQILKLYAWEPSFQAQVHDVREKELKVMRKFAYLSSVSTFIFSCAPALVGAMPLKGNSHFTHLICSLCLFVCRQTLTERYGSKGKDHYRRL